MEYYKHVNVIDNKQVIKLLNDIDGYVRKLYIKDKITHYDMIMLTDNIQLLRDELRKGGIK